MFNLQTHGEYEYVTQMIEINNELFHRSALDMSRIINSTCPSGLKGREVDLYQTYMHEMTHFLDSTTTIWGLQYTARMYRWFNDKNAQCLEVFALDDSEITMHQMLSQEESELSLAFEQIKFSLEYAETVGLYVHLHYLNGQGGRLQSIPLSMLSLFEGNAYAQEKLVTCRMYEDDNDVVSLSLLEREISERISNLKSSEYTGLLALVMQIFPRVKLSRKLELLSIISKFCFNAPASFMMMLPEGLLKVLFSGAPDNYVSALKMEFSRGSHRSILALVVLLSIVAQVGEQQERLNELSQLDIEELILQICNSNGETVQVLREMLKSFWLIEFELLAESCNKSGAKLAFLMANQVKERNWYSTELDDLMLPQIMLSSGELINHINPLNFDMEKHSDDMLYNNIELEKALKNYGIKREHLSPSFHHGWLEHMRNEGTGLYVHE
jgi:hypothetical protein